MVGEAKAVFDKGRRVKASLYSREVFCSPVEGLVEEGDARP